MKTLQLKIIGSVHDVGFRWQTEKLARELNLAGWVKNEPDGSVQIVAQGEKNNLEKLLAWAKIGPRFAAVRKVEVKWTDLMEAFAEFEIRY